MISKKLNNIIKFLEGKGKMAFLTGATKEEIAEFEKSNSISFPEQYKEWLSFSDGGELFLPAGIQLYGVAHKPLIDVNYDDRPNNKYVVIGALSTGDPVLFKRGKTSIAIYNHEEAKIEDDEVYRDFYSFLEDLHNLLGIGD